MLNSLLPFQLKNLLYYLLQSFFHDKVYWILELALLILCIALPRAAKLKHKLIICLEIPPQNCSKKCSYSCCYAWHYYIKNYFRLFHTSIFHRYSHRYPFWLSLKETVKKQMQIARRNLNLKIFTPLFQKNVLLII